MKQTNIIQSLCDLVDGKIVVENEEYKKQKDKADKWYEQLEKYLKEDKELYNVFCNFDLENGTCNEIAQELYFKEGFLRGARIAMEICGYCRED